MFLDDIVGRMSVEEARMSGADKWRQHFDQETAPARAEFNKSTEHYNRLKTDPAYKEQQFKAWQEKIHGKKDVAENYEDDDAEGESEIQNGSYVTDTQDSTGEVYLVSQYEPGARRCWIGDQDGRGWYISPDRLEMCDDPRKINQYFGKKEYDEDSWSSEKSVGTGDAWSGQSHEMVEADPNAPYTPSPAKPFRNPPGFNKQGTSVGNRFADLNRAELNQWRMGMSMAGEKEPTQSKGTPVPAKAFAQGIEKDLQKAMTKPKIQVKKNKGVAEDEGDAEGLPHLTRELLTHIVQQVGKEGAHAIVKSLEWGDGAARELLHLIVTDLKNNIEPNLDEHIGKVKGGFRLYSHKGKNLGTFPSKSGAEKHEREVQYFKHANESINEALNDASPVTGAITRRILSQRLDLLKQYGPELVGAAIDNVADYVGDVDEISKEDVSAWVNQVERMLRDNPPEAFDEGVAEGNHEGMYSPEAIKMGNHFIKEFNLTDDIDQQLAIEIVDNCLEGGLTDPMQIKKQVIKYLRQSGTNIQSRKQGVAEGDKEKADKITLNPIMKEAYSKTPTNLELLKDLATQWQDGSDTAYDAINRLGWNIADDRKGVYIIKQSDMSGRSKIYFPELTAEVAKAKEEVKESYWAKLQNERSTKLNNLVNELKENIK